MVDVDAGVSSRDGGTRPIGAVSIENSADNTFTRSQCRYPDGRIREWSGLVYGSPASEQAGSGVVAADDHNRQRWKQLGFARGKSLCSRTGDVFLTRSNGIACEFENEIDDPSVVGISVSLCCGGGGLLRRASDTQKRRGEYRPGMMDLYLPAKGGYIIGPDASNVGVGIRLKKLQWLSANLGVKKFVEDCDPGGFFRDALLEQLLVNVVALAEDNALSAVFLDHALHLIMARLFDQPVKTAVNGRSFTPRELRRVCEFIDANIGHDIGLAELSALVALSPSEFSRRFRGSLGVPPYAYLKQQRMRRGGELLTQSDRTVSDIGNAVGYASPTQFSKAFRNETGMTPTAWRRTRIE